VVANNIFEIRICIYSPSVLLNNDPTDTWLLLIKENCKDYFLIETLYVKVFLIVQCKGISLLKMIT